ncbi:MAG: hypothetical protein PHC92_00535 [Syntrophomonadaceae bacterium]|nr:hypothetical protein [Syntrophomonadaceae bacterium]
MQQYVETTAQFLLMLESPPRYRYAKETAPHFFRGFEAVFL